jgi:hypothetical protein
MSRLVKDLAIVRQRSVVVRGFWHHLPRWAIVAIVGLVLSVMHPAIAQEGLGTPAGTAGDAVPGVSRTAVRQLVEGKMAEFDIPGLALVVVKGSEIAHAGRLRAGRSSERCSGRSR